jgi:hypothetical protein
MFHCFQNATVHHVTIYSFLRHILTFCKALFSVKKTYNICTLYCILSGTNAATKKLWGPSLLWDPLFSWGPRRKPPPPPPPPPPKNELSFDVINDILRHYINYFSNGSKLTLLQTGVLARILVITLEFWARFAVVLCGNILKINVSIMSQGRSI